MDHSHRRWAVHPDIDLGRTHHSSIWASHHYGEFPQVRCSTIRLTVFGPFSAGEKASPHAVAAGQPQGGFSSSSPPGMRRRNPTTVKGVASRQMEPLMFSPSLMAYNQNEHQVYFYIRYGRIIFHANIDTSSPFSPHVVLVSRFFVQTMKCRAGLSDRSMPSGPVFLGTAPAPAPSGTGSVRNNSKIPTGSTGAMADRPSVSRLAAFVSCHALLWPDMTCPRLEDLEDHLCRQQNSGPFSSKAGRLWGGCVNFFNLLPIVNAQPSASLTVGGAQHGYG